MKYLLFKTFCFSIFLIISTFYFSCSSAGEKCAFGEPTALLSDTIKLVSKHYFEVKDNKSIERATFKNGVEMEFTQSGCKKIIRNFQFKLNGELSKQGKDFWVAQAVGSFKFLGSISAQAQSLYYLANSIDKKAESIKLGAETSLEEGFDVKIDKIVGPESGLLIIVLTQK